MFYKTVYSVLSLSQNKKSTSYQFYNMCCHMLYIYTWIVESLSHVTGISKSQLNPYRQLISENTNKFVLLRVSVNIAGIKGT